MFDESVQLVLRLVFHVITTELPDLTMIVPDVLFAVIDGGFPVPDPLGTQLLPLQTVPEAQAAVNEA